MWGISGSKCLFPSHVVLSASLANICRLAFYSKSRENEKKQGIVQGALVLAISKTNMSVAPTSVRSSITVAIFFFSTMALTAIQPSSSKAVMVGARLPGVILVAF